MVIYILKALILWTTKYFICKTEMATGRKW